MNTTAIEDLTELLDCNYEELSRAKIWSSAGMLFGAVSGGLLADMFPIRIDLILAVELVLLSVATLVLPWCPSIALMGMAFFLQGFAEGGLTSGKCYTWFS